MKPWNFIAAFLALVALFLALHVVGFLVANESRIEFAVASVVPLPHLIALETRGGAAWPYVLLQFGLYATLCALKALRLRTALIMIGVIHALSIAIHLSFRAFNP